MALSAKAFKELSSTEKKKYLAKHPTSMHHGKKKGSVVKPASKHAARALTATGRVRLLEREKKQATTKEEKMRIQHKIYALNPHVVQEKKWRAMKKAKKTS